MPIQSIAENDRRELLAASVGQTAFTFDFPIYQQEDITVVRLRSGAATLLTVETHYTVSGVEEQAGGTVTLTSASLAGDQILITGAMAAQRTAYYVDGGDLPAQSLNDDLNRLYVLAQERATAAQNSPFLNAADLDPLELPLAGARAGTILGFDSAGNAVLVTIPTGEIDGNPRIWGGTNGGTANAITLTTAPALTEIPAGVEFAWIAAATNTDAMTVAIDGLSPIALRKGNAGTELEAGDVQEDALVRAVSDGTVLIMPLAGTGGGGGGGDDTHVLWLGAASGTGDAMTAAPSPALASYYAGLRVAVITPAGNGNGGAVTLQISALAAAAVNKGDGTVDLEDGDLPGGTLVDLMHDGTRFRLMGVAAAQRPAVAILAEVWCGDSSGTSTALTIVPPVAVDFARPFELGFRAHVAIGDAPTLTIGATAYDWKKVDTEGTMADLATGDVFADQPVRLLWDPDLAQFTTTSPLASVPSAGGGGGGGASAWATVSQVSGTSAVATVDVALPSGYRRFELLVSDLAPVTTGAKPTWRMSTNGGVSYATTGYEYTLAETLSGGVTAAASGGASRAHLTNSGQNTTGRAIGRIELDPTNKVALTAWTFRENAADELAHAAGSSIYGGAGTPTHIRLMFDSGNIARYNVTLLGLA